MSLLERFYRVVGTAVAQRAAVALINISNQLERIERKIDKMAETQEELAAEMTATKDRVAKIGTETQKLLDLIKALQEQLAQGGPLTQGVKDANEALKAQVGIVDDLVADV